MSIVVMGIGRPSCGDNIIHSVESCNQPVNQFWVIHFYTSVEYSNHNTVVSFRDFPSHVGFYPAILSMDIPLRSIHGIIWATIV